MYTYMYVYTHIYIFMYISMSISNLPGMVNDQIASNCMKVETSEAETEVNLRNSNVMLLKRDS